jgi:hypothetical protein
MVQPEDGFIRQVAQDATRFRPSHVFGLNRTMQIKPYLRRDQLFFIRHGHKTNYSSDDHIAFPVPARGQAYKQHQQINVMETVIFTAQLLLLLFVRSQFNPHGR